MGAIYNVFCKTCGQEWELLTGMGMRHSTLKAVAESYSEDVATQLISYEKENPYAMFHFSLHPAKCDKCKNLMAVPVLKIKDTDKEYVGTCGSCGEVPVLIDDLGTCECPNCREISLNVNEIGSWD